MLGVPLQSDEDISTDAGNPTDLDLGGVESPDDTPPDFINDFANE